MGRPLRWLRPRQRWFVTSRCLEARFLLRPDVAMKQRFGFWLAKATQRFPGIRVHAAIQLSNHTHLCVTDDDGSLAAFCGYFFGMLARDVNELRDRSGPAFHRRYSAEPLLDREATLQKIAYLVCNPVEAGLVRDWREWPGVLVFTQTRDHETHSYRRLDAIAYRAAKARAGRERKTVKQSDFWMEGVLILHPFDEGDADILDPAAICDAVDGRQRALVRIALASRFSVARPCSLRSHMQRRSDPIDRCDRCAMHRPTPSEKRSARSTVHS